MYRPDCYDTDPRVRSYCVPTRVMHTWNDVSNTDALLIKRPSQIPLNTPADWQPSILKNKGNGNPAVLVDFGCEFHGSARIYVQYVKNQTSRADFLIRFGESATEAITPVGQRGSTNDHANRDFVMNCGSWSANESNCSGYRFLYVELLSPDTEVGLYMLQGVVIQRDMPRKGSFCCSDEVINNIYETAAYTAFLCCQEYLWDGIKRDRLIWCGDMYPSTLTLTAVFGDTKVLRDSLDMQKRITPSNEWMNGMPSYSLWWTLCHDLLYRLYGDKAYLEEQVQYISEMLHNAARFIAVDGSETLPGAFLDWPNNENKQAVHAGQQALAVHAFERAEYIFTIFEREDDAKFCRETAAHLRKAIVNPNGSKQASALMAMWGLADPKFIDDTIISPNGAHGYSTFLGYGTLAVKALAGNMNGALEDMKAYWGRMLELGATTFWEDFNLDWAENACGIDELVPAGCNDIHADHGAYCYTGLRHSLCHAWASGPAPFLADYVLGIKPIEPGCKTVSVKPDLGFLSWAEGTYPTPRGELFVRAEKDENGVTKVTVKAPSGVKVITE